MYSKHANVEILRRNVDFADFLNSISYCTGNSIALFTIHRMKLERQRTVFFVFVAGLAFADLMGQILTTFPVLLTYSHGYYIGGVRHLTVSIFINCLFLAETILSFILHPICFHNLKNEMIYACSKFIRTQTLNKF